MIKEALEYVIRLAQPTITEVNGLPYTRQDLRLVAPPEVPVLELGTLSSLVDFCREQNSTVGLVHVEDHRTVTVYAPAHVLWGRRTKLVNAQWEKFHFEFGRFYDQAEFVIKLLSQFHQSDVRDELVKMISSVKEETVKLSTDDGLSQQVVARKGVMVENRTLPKTVVLAPCRTFSEAGVITGEFILRAQDGPRFALFDVVQDFPQRAAYAVADYLREQLPDLTVLL